MLEVIWETRDGRRVPVSKMSDSHLANAINLILRKQTWRREYLDRLLLETEIRALKR